MSHPVRYTQKGDVHIAFQVVGDGPIDLVYTPGIWSNLDVMWDEPRWAPYLRRLASFSRLIVFDMRGVGLSDRGPEPPLVEVQTDDIGAVMDAASSETAAVLGGARGAAAALLVRGLASRAHAGAGAVRACRANTGSAPGFPWGWTVERWRESYERFVTGTGTSQNLDREAPSVADDDRFKQW